MAVPHCRVKNVKKIQEDIINKRWLNMTRSLIRLSIFHRKAEETSGSGIFFKFSACSMQITTKVSISLYQWTNITVLRHELQEGNGSTLNQTLIGSTMVTTQPGESFQPYENYIFKHMPSYSLSKNRRMNGENYHITTKFWEMISSCHICFFHTTKWICKSCHPVSFLKPDNYAWKD